MDAFGLPSMGEPLSINLVIVNNDSLLTESDTTLFVINIPRDIPTITGTRIIYRFFKHYNSLECIIKWVNYWSHDYYCNRFKYIIERKSTLPQYRIQTTQSTIPKLAIAILAVIFSVGLFVVGFDQGHIFSLVMGESAFDEMLIHELTHDLRHAAGFPCH